ncbi:MAG: right-handed parallel beta-helix repeat-containing protein, partial [Chloroflexota bacterium]
MLLRLRIFTRRRSQALSFALILLFIMFFSTLTPQIAHAATFTVTTAADHNDGSCDADCSLREAINAANSAGGANTISFSGLFSSAQTITLTSNLPGLSSNITITGPGANLLTIDGANAHQVFFTGGGTTVSISGMTITHGSTNFAGAAIFSDSDVNVDGVAFTSNTATANGGAAIWVNNGTTTVTNSTFSGNTATSGTGGAINVPSGGTLFMINSTMTGNSAIDGGAIAASGPITLINSTISGNSATSTGGITNGSTSTFTNTIIANNAGGDCS